MVRRNQLGGSDKFHERLRLVHGGSSDLIKSERYCDVTHGMARLIKSICCSIRLLDLSSLFCHRRGLYTASVDALAAAYLSTLVPVLCWFLALCSAGGFYKADNYCLTGGDVASSGHQVPDAACAIRRLCKRER